MARTLFVALLLVMVLSACAPAKPTADPAQIQASAVAAASTMIAQTIQAVPTETPVPPTDVPSPTPLPPPTLALLPTLPVAQSAPTTASSAATNCNQPLDVAAAGPKANVMIKNNTKGSITFNMGISTKNTFGQCGYMSWPINKGDSISVSVPQIRTNLGDSCYWVYVWINDPKAATHGEGSGYCIDNALKWTFTVTSPNKVTLAPP